MVGWVEESADRRDERWEWLRAQDVMPVGEVVGSAGSRLIGPTCQVSRGGEPPSGDAASSIL